MSTAPFSLLWQNNSGEAMPTAGFPVGFPGTTSIAQILQVSSNALALQTFESLVGVGFFLVGDAEDVNTVQYVWPALGGVSEPQLNGGLDISFDNGQTYTRFDSTNGVQANPATWISLPVTAVGSQGVAEVISAFDVAHFIIRFVIPPGATQYGVLNLSLGMGFDVI
jgi:hypothetical protein